MLRIKKIDVIEEKSQLLYSSEFTPELLQEEFKISAGKWAIEDGYLIGFMEEDGGGLIYSKKEFSGDVLLDFYAKTVKPYDNDLNFTFCAAG